MSAPLEDKSWKHETLRRIKIRKRSISIQLSTICLYSFICNSWSVANICLFWWKREEITITQFKTQLKTPLKKYKIMKWHEIINQTLYRTKEIKVHDLNKKSGPQQKSGFTLFAYVIQKDYHLFLSTTQRFKLSI